MATPNLFRLLLALIHALTLFTARKILSFLLPIPFFPAVSSVLANLVGIDPTALKPHLLKPPPVLQNHLPTSLIPAFFSTAKTPLQSETIEPSEKIRTGRQRDILTMAEQKIADEIAHLPGLSMDQGRKTVERPNIQTVDFGGSLEKEVTDAIDNVESLQPVSSSVLALTIFVFFFDSSDGQVPRLLAAIHLTPTQHDEHLEDEDYAKLSAEKQVFEQTRKMVKAPLHDFGILLGATTSSEQDSPEPSVSEAGQPPIPIPLTAKAPPLALPTGFPPIPRHGSSAVSSPESASTTSSVRLPTAIAEATPHSDLDLTSSLWSWN